MPYKDAETQKAYLRAYDREYYRKNREHLLIKQKEKNKRYLEKVGAWLNEYKKDCRARDVLRHIRRLFSFTTEIRVKKIFPPVCSGAENTVKKGFWQKSLNVMLFAPIVTQKNIGVIYTNSYINTL